MINLGGLRNDYELMKAGILSRGSIALPSKQGIFSGSSAKGDYVSARVAVGHVNSPRRYENKVMVDIAGEGPGSLRYVDQTANLFGRNVTPLVLSSVAYRPGLTPDTTIPLAAVYRDQKVGQAIVRKAVSTVGDSTETTVEYVTTDDTQPTEPVDDQ